MCGIAGSVGVSVSSHAIEQIMNTMIRRGPDATGVYQHRDCCLLHSRLAVIDPEGGTQPMILDWAGQRYVIVYNGELYNTKEIRGELIREGHQFHGHSDTEVVLHSYAAWGEACLDRFNGIFAFAVWEEGCSRLFLARDRMGVKPLFYLHRNKELIFGSEIKSILAYPDVKPTLRPEGAVEILMLGPGRIPGSGVIHGISELEPGCCGYFERGKWNIRRYWKLRDREHRDSFEETAQMVRNLVTDAIRGQMISDVPIGTFLSGGLDSSLISALCAEEMCNRGQQLQTFSVDYENNDRYFVPGKFQPNSDNYYIGLMQQHLGTDHHWTVLTPSELVESLEDATIARDLPGMADVDSSLLAFCRQIRPHVKVSLSGECADEIFGGYPWYRDPEIRDTEGFPWSQNALQRVEIMSPYLNNQIDGLDFIRQLYLDTCRQSDILPGVSAQERRIKEMVNLNFRWFMQTLLERKDRMSMYWGLEVRVPFCDYRIAEYLYGVPWEFKNYMGVEKGLLRYAMRGVLPDEVLWRKKSPYPKTHDPRYMDLVSGRLRQITDQRDRVIWQICDRDKVKKLMTEEYPWPWYGQLMRAPQTVAYLLQIDFWLQQYQVDLNF